MRALADHLDVKASSLYWHVRDRRELLELLADAILEKVPSPRAHEWRAAVVEAATGLGRQVARQRDADRILLEVPEALERSDVYAGLKRRLQSAGLHESEAGEVALLVMIYVIAGRTPGETPVTESAAPAKIAIDTGSRGVVLRAGSADMESLFRIPHDQVAAEPAVVRGETVIVRRLRGVGLGEIDLNPRRSWRFQIQAPTWNTVLDVGGLDVREIRVDSGATRVECFLPAPRGIVPIHISSGVVGVSLHRPKGTAVVALARTGAVKFRLDKFASKVAVFDVHWESEGASSAADRYELEISGGVWNLELDTYTPKIARPEVAASEPPSAGEAASALDMLLDGVEARVRSRS